jgi:hypothetical protein
MTKPSNVLPENLHQTEPHERRRERRWKVFKRAWLVLESGLVPCAVRDITENGARLQVPTNVTLPESFRIFIMGDEVMMNARRVWSTLDEIGVRFTDRQGS